MHKLIFLVVVTLVVVIGQSGVYAQTSAALLLDYDTEVTLTVKPHICIAPRGDLSCISRIDVFWESNRVTDVCLHVSLLPESLQCWEQSNSGAYRHNVTMIKNLDYWVTSKNQKHTWAKSSVKYAALKPHRKQKRRRNHLPWSIQSL